MAEIDQIIHEPVRLRIMSILYLREVATFKDFKESMKVTDGNLSQHLKKLEDEGYIRIEKTFEGRRPKTYYYITEKGRKKFREYINTLEEILRSVKGNSE